MDIKEKKAFEIAFENKLGAHCCQFDLDEDGNYEDRDTLCGWHMWLEAKAQAVPDLGELQERIAGHQYYHDAHGHMIVDMDDVVKEISGFDSWKSQAVPEWVNYELEKPKDGQKCLVVFESMDGDDSHRWMCIDEFNEGMFDFIANWEDECASVALPAGSVISKVRAVCWAETNLSNAPLSFDQFYKAQEPAND